jgi:hypothetical protein
MLSPFGSGQCGACTVANVLRHLRPVRRDREIHRIRLFRARAQRRAQLQHRRRVPRLRNRIEIHARRLAPLPRRRSRIPQGGMTTRRPVCRRGLALITVKLGAARGFAPVPPPHRRHRHSRWLLCIGIRHEPRTRAAPPDPKRSCSLEQRVGGSNPSAPTIHKAKIEQGVYIQMDSASAFYRYSGVDDFVAVPASLAGPSEEMLRSIQAKLNSNSAMARLLSRNSEFRMGIVF